MAKKNAGTSKALPVMAVRGQQFIRDWRKASGMSVGELGAKAGLSGSMVAQLERGATGYTQRSLEALAKALGVPAWQLLCCGPSDVASAQQHIGDAAKMWDGIPEAIRPMAREIIGGQADNIRALIKLIYFAKQTEREAA